MLNECSDSISKSKSRQKQSTTFQRQSQQISTCCICILNQTINKFMDNHWSAILLWAFGYNPDDTKLSKTRHDIVL